MMSQKAPLSIAILALCFHAIIVVTLAQETFEHTITVNEKQDFSIYTGGPYLFWDDFTIIASSGIDWLRVVDGSVMGDIWEKSFMVLYDGVPISGVTTECVKRPPPCEGCYWQGATTLSLVALGQGTITIRFRKLWTEGPFPIEGEYLDQRERSTLGAQYGEIAANPNSVQPGNTTNIRVTIPNRIRPHISGVTIQLPTAYDEPKNFVTLPFDMDGVYDYPWTVPTGGYFERLNGPTPMSIIFTAASNRKNASGQFYNITGGETFITIASTLNVTMSSQGIAIPLGQNFTWIANREKIVSASINLGKEPFKTRWIVNGQEINVSVVDEIPASRGRTLKDQNVLENAGTITFEVTDANGNRATGTIYAGIKTGMDFEISVQGRVVEPGTTSNWKETSQKMVTTRQTVIGELPYRTRWIIDGVEMMSSTSRVAHFRFDDQEILDKARSVTFEVTDANDVQKTYTIYIGNPEEDKDTARVPTGPVGPAPAPPPITGDPNREPNSDVDWNNRPWLNERVRQCAREYLQNIVLYMENEYVKWENTGLPKDKQRVLFTSIDDWGRLLNPYITTSGGVDGNWDNPTHFVWSVFNKPEAASKYGRTIDYYCKFECASLEPSPDDIKSAIDDVSDDEENNKWDDQKVRNAQNNLNNLLDLARSLYNQFNSNYDKFVNEINDQNSNPLQNEVIALCLASAQNQLADHSVNKDTVDAAGNSLIAQSTTNKNIEMFAIIRILSEVQVQADDMNKKMDEMRDLLASRGGDIDEILTSGQQLIAQGNVNPEFAQDGGVNVEFFGDGIDNFGDGLQDFMQGNIRRGNVLIVVWDAGNVADDIFGVSLSGRGGLGDTPPGGRRTFDESLSPGSYTLTITGIYTDPNSPPCTYGIQVYDQDNLILQEVDLLEVNQSKEYTLTIQ